MEFKKIGKKENPKKATEEALEQIERKNYATELRDRGITKILALGMAFQGKSVTVQERRINGF